MGALFFFNKMLPSIKEESSDSTPERQVEIYTYAHKIFLRIGPINAKDEGIDRYTVEISRDSAQEILKELKSSMDYLGWDA
jgi:hypothetical protein